MKYLLLLLFTTNSYAQEFSRKKKKDTLLNHHFMLGASFGPSLSAQSVRNIEDFSVIPNLEFSYGNKLLNIHLSVGAISRLGFISMAKWTYSGARYTINSINKGFIEHGPEITTGFNYFFGPQKHYRFFAGSSIAMIFINSRNLKVVMRPIIIGLTFNLLSKKSNGIQ